MTQVGSDLADVVEITSRIVVDYPVGATGSIDLPWVSTAPIPVELYAGETLLDAITVSGKASYCP